MTILAWSSPSRVQFILDSSTDSHPFRGFDPYDNYTDIPCGVLATAPSFFADSGEYVPLRRSSKTVSITAQGLSVKMSLKSNLHLDLFTLDLNCRRGDRPGTHMCVSVKRLSRHQYIRIRHSLDERKESPLTWMERNVRLIKTNEEALSKRFDGYTLYSVLGWHNGSESLSFTIKNVPQESRATLVAILTTHGWGPPQNVFLMPTLWGTGIAVLRFQIPQSGQNFAVLIGRLGRRPGDLLQLVNKFPIRPAYTLIDVPNVESFEITDFWSISWRRAQKARHTLKVDHTESNGQLVEYHIHASLKKDKAMGRGAFYIEVTALRSEKKSKVAC